MPQSTDKANITKLMPVVNDDTRISPCPAVRGFYTIPTGVLPGTWLGHKSAM